MPADTANRALRDIDKVRALLRAKKLPGDYLFQLIDYEKQLKAGYLPTEDRNYIDALYQWYQAESDGGVSAQHEADAGTEGKATALEDRLLQTEQQLRLSRARIDQLEQEINDLTTGYEQQIKILRRKLDAALAGIDDVREHSETAPAPDRKFDELRRLFARLFHPDNIEVDGVEREVRIDIFKTFWSEITRIERS